MGFKVILQKQIFNGAKCLFDGLRLRDDVDAVALMFDHVRKPFSLAADEVEAANNTFLNALFHVANIPP